MHRVVISAAREALGYGVDDLLDLCSHHRRLHKDRSGADVVSAELRRIAAAHQVPTSTIRLA